MAEPQVDMKFEVTMVGVSNVDRAKAFYENLGWRLDGDVASDGFHGVQLTPHNSEASIIFGKGVTSPKPGSAGNLVLVVNDIGAARKELIARGVKVSEVFHYAGGPFNDSVKNSHVSGRDPQGRSYHSFASFEDPDGNHWLLQEIRTRLPGREWTSTRGATDVPKLADLLRETADHHDPYEKTHGEHHWWDWYAAYLSARQNGSGPEEAGAAAGRYMEEVLHVLPR